MFVRTVCARRAVAWHVCGLTAFLLFLYLLFPTRNHYWDGIGFALNIEGIAADQKGYLVEQTQWGAIYYNPNHLLYNAIGGSLFESVKVVWPQSRALDVLVLWSTACSVLTACLLFGLLLRFSGRIDVSLWLALLFALSATWWKFSTDANAYVPSTSALVLCAWLATRPGKPPALTIGMLHALAMLLHQIAIWFYPAMWVAIFTHRAWTARPQRIRAVAGYTIVSASLVAAAYLVVWFVALDRAWDPARFLAWITSNGGDVLSRKPLAQNVLDMLRASLRVFFGGRFSLALRHGAMLVPAAGVVLVSAVVMIRWFWRGREIRLDFVKFPKSARFLIAWLASFLAFLSFWLTEFPYYRLFCLPAFVVVLGILLRSSVPRRVPVFHPLPAFVGLMAALNFTLYIYPYSLPEASPPLQIALQARSLWREPVVLYFAEFTCDNWWVKYFNMHTTWRKANLRNYEHLSSQARREIRNGRRVFIDTGVLAHLDAKPEARAALESEVVVSKPFGVSNGKHHIQFAELHLNDGGER